MSTVQVCPGCHDPFEPANLRKDGHIRCPSCGQLFTPDTAPTESRWYYAKGKAKWGPVPFEELQNLAATGNLGPTEMILQVGATKWVPAGTFKKHFVFEIPVAGTNEAIPMAEPVPEAIAVAVVKPSPAGFPVPASPASAAGNNARSQSWKLYSAAGAGCFGAITIPTAISLIFGFMFIHYYRNRDQQRQQQQRNQWQQQQEAEKKRLLERPPPILGGKMCDRCLGSGKSGIIRCPDCGGRGSFPPPQDGAKPRLSP